MTDLPGVAALPPDLQDIATFVQVIRAGSFTRAAEDMVLPKSSVSRRVARLEQRLGAQLLQRTTRSITLTETGETFHARASAALEELTTASTLATEAARIPRGRVRMAAPQDVGAEVLPTIIASFSRLYPQVHVELDLMANDPDVITGRYDVVLRIGEHATEAHSIKVQDTQFRIYASPSYLASAPAIQRIDDLAHHDCIVVRGMGIWRMTNKKQTTATEVHGSLETNDLTFARRAGIAGAGLVLLPDLVGQPEITRGTLVAVLPLHHSRGLPLWLDIPWKRHIPVRVEALRDHLLTHFPQ
jgi:DNA-binding transcriptional LysR family regulator